MKNIIGFEDFAIIPINILPCRSIWSCRPGKKPRYKFDSMAFDCRFGHSQEWLGDFDKFEVVAELIASKSDLDKAGVVVLVDAIAEGLDQDRNRRFFEAHGLNSKTFTPSEKTDKSRTLYSIMRPAGTLNFSDRIKLQILQEK